MDPHSRPPSQKMGAPPKLAVLPLTNCCSFQVFPLIRNIGADMSGMAWIMMSSPTFWLAFIFIPLTTLLWDLVLKRFVCFLL